MSDKLQFVDAWKLLSYDKLKFVGHSPVCRSRPVFHLCNSQLTAL